MLTCRFKVNLHQARADITIMDGELFKKIARAARLKKDFK